MSEVDITSNIKSVWKRIREAAERADRDPGQITLVAVSKQVSAERIIEAASCGADTFGENYAQELRDKLDLVSGGAGSPVKWHFIGRLQSNKVKYLVGNVELIHSLDSVSVAQEINKRAGAAGIKKVHALIEVNTAGEESKGGVEPEVLGEFISELSGYKALSVDGLMTMAPYFDDPESARPYFRKLREMRDGLLETFGGLTELSMGMSGDFEVAIEEGATIVRIGSAIFGERQY